MKSKNIKCKYSDFEPVKNIALTFLNTEESIKDEMETFFIAENMKYFYLTFSNNIPVNPEDYVFNTEAHPFKKSSFKAGEINRRLAINQ